MPSDEPAPAPAARSYDAVFHGEADLRNGKVKVGDRLPGKRALTGNAVHIEWFIAHTRPLQ